MKERIPDNDNCNWQQFCHQNIIQILVTPLTQVFTDVARLANRSTSDPYHLRLLLIYLKKHFDKAATC